MAGAIPLPGGPSTLTPDSSEAILSQARGDAQASLKSAFPDQNMQFEPASRTDNSASVSARGSEQVPPTEEPIDPNAPPPGSTPVGGNAPPEGSTPALPALPPEKAGWVAETGKAWMRGSLTLANLLGYEVAGAANLVGGGEASDKVFDFLKEHVDGARENWKANQNASTGQKILSGAVENLTPLMLGGLPGGITAFAGSAATDAAKESIDRGEDLTTAETLAAVRGISAAVMPKAVTKLPGMLARIVTSIPLGVTLNAATEKLTQMILSDRGYQKAADDIDPLDPTQTTITALMQAIFAATTKGRAGKAKDVPAAPDLTKPSAAPAPAGPAGGEPPPPGSVPVAAATTPTAAAAKPVVVKPVVADNPTREPLADLKAQIDHMNDEATDRKAVYLSADNVAALGADGVKALAAGKPSSSNFDGKGGVMIFANVGERIKAGKAKKIGDMQAVIGAFTGAGEGKSPDQTAVVQGHTPEGAVATESMVAPHEVPAKVAEVVAEGKTPVVTTPEAAVARRAALTAGDRVTLTTPNGERGVVVAGAEKDGMIPVHLVGEDGEISKAVTNAKAELLKGGMGEEPAPAPAAAEIPKEGTPVPKKGKVKLVVGKDLKASEQAPVESQPAAEPTAPEAAKPVEPAAEPTAPEAAKPVEPAAEPAVQEFPAPEAAKPVEPEAPKTVRSKGETIPDLDKAAKSFTANEAKIAKKKVKGGLADRVRDVAGFAQIVKAAANHAADKGISDDAAIQRATEAANAAIKLGDKSTEEITKGQGVGHVELDAHSAELRAAAEQLQGREAPVRAPEGDVRQTKLRARIAKAKADIVAKRADAGSEVPDTGETVSAGGKDRPLSEVVNEAKKRGVRPTFKDVGAELEVAPNDRQRVIDAIKKASEKRSESKETKDVGKVKAIADVEDEVKIAKKKEAEEGPLRELNKDEKKQLQRALDNYKMSGEGAVQYHRTNLERIVHDLFKPGDETGRTAVMHIMDSADAQRAEEHGTSARDTEEGPEEQHVRGIDYADTDRGGFDSPLSASIKNANRGWAELHGKLVESGMWKQFVGHMDTGANMYTHGILDHMIDLAEPGSGLHDLLTKLRAHVPDTVVRSVSRIKDDHGDWRDHSRGMHSLRSGIQIKANEGMLTRPQGLITLIHEMIHAATVKFMNDNPTHPYTMEIERLRGIAEKRLRSMYPDEMVDSVVNASKPVTAEARILYGLKNSAEYITEAMTNGEFSDLLNQSEHFALSGEKLPAVDSIKSRLINAVRKMLGIKRPDSARLLDATLHISGKIMEAQHAAREGIKRPDFPGMHAAIEAGKTMSEFAAFKGAEARMSVPRTRADMYEALDDARPLQNEDKIRDVIGARATKVARDTYNAIRKNVLGGIRDAVLPLKSASQLIRDGKVWFGRHDDATNPLRQLDEANSAGYSRTNEIMERGKPIAERWSRLSIADNKQLGEFMKDSTIWGIDPTVAKDKHAKVTQKMPKFDPRYDEYQQRWNNMSDEQKAIYGEVRDYNNWAARKNRNAGIDTALRAFSDTEVPLAIRQLLYSVRSGKQYESMIGHGKLIDVGDRNSELIKGLHSLASMSQLEGPYFHLGRHGDYVVQINPEGTKEGFKTKEAAEAHAAEIEDLSPESEATAFENPDGTHGVDYKIDYTSMHENKTDAEAEAQRLTDRGFNVGSVTSKILSSKTAPLSAGIEQLVAEASRRINRGGSDAGSQSLVDTLRTTFVQMMAARSAYAGSKLMRKGTGGVKGEEMLRNWASHTQALAWGTGQLHSVFAKGEALGKVRQAAKDSSVDQKTAYERGRVMTELNARLQQEQSQYGQKSPLNSITAKLGFMNFLASPSHAFIWMTQNFTTSIPTAGARWGYARSVAAFGRAMNVVSGPAFRTAMLAHIKPGTMGSHDILQAVIAAVRKDPHLGKWAQGENSHLKQIMDRGAISTSFSNELGNLAKGDSHITNRVMDYARLMPHMADVFNRVSTALAGLELTGGDVYKAADFVRETHMDYSGGEKPRAFKALNRVPGANSVTMFRTYTQGMAHLLYSNIHAMVTAEGKPRAEAAKTVAGVMLGTALLAGITKGVVIEPARLAYYAWKKLFADDNEFHDLDNSIDKFMSDLLGHDAGEAVARGLPRLLGFDLSSRMGLGDLFFHDMPDLLSSDKGAWTDFAMALAGPMAQYAQSSVNDFTKHMQDGEPFQALTSVVPLKLLTDAMKASQLATGGKINDKGAVIVDPSIGGAVSRLIGFKPASEAEAQERQRVAYEVKKQAAARKTVLMRRALKDGYESMSDEIGDFNDANPGSPITYKDFRRAQMIKQNDEDIARGEPVRNPGINEAEDY